MQPSSSPERATLGEDEFQALLAERLPNLAQKLARLAELETQFAAALEREKLAALKELAYGASHEINNPLANISTRAQALLRDETDPERRRKLATMVTQAFRAHEMISDMMLYAKPPKLARELVDVVVLVDRVIAELTTETKEQGTTISRSGEPSSLVASVDPVQCAVALKALLSNSLEALGRSGQVMVSVRKVAPATDQTESGVEILIRDNGPGISPEVRRHLFDPFYSGREAGRGLGFGLSKCWRIVTDHGGRIDVESEVGKGATFRLFFPAPLG